MRQNFNFLIGIIFLCGLISNNPIKVFAQEKIPYSQAKLTGKSFKCSYIYSASGGWGPSYYYEFEAKIKGDDFIAVNTANVSGQKLKEEMATHYIRKNNFEYLWQYSQQSENDFLKLEKSEKYDLNMIKDYKGKKWLFAFPLSEAECERIDDFNILIPNLDFPDKTQSILDEINAVYEYKPIIYLYPTKEEAVLVKLDYQGDLVATYPQYDEQIKGWKVTAYPDGKIIGADGNEYSYLFWEGVPSKPVDYDFSKGFVVKGDDSAEFLRETLSKMGLLPKEYNEFIIFWYPQMKKNKYNLIYFSNQEREKLAPLEITPAPDSILRVFMVFKPVTKDVVVEPQEIESFVRTGFAVVEWGGSEIK